jgi:transposase-like protein
MRKRRTADQVARLLRDVDHDLAKGLTVSDVCRKIGIAETTPLKWLTLVDE